MASSGVGSMGHLTGELLKITAGVDFVHVPYRGAGPALTDLLAGQVATSFAGLAGSIEYIRTGRLRALAVSTATRVEALPDVPTVGEFLPGFEADDWLGVGAPKDTPADIIERLNKEIAAGAGRSENQGALRGVGRHCVCAVAGRIRQASCRRNGEMGQGGSGGQHPFGIDIRPNT